MKKKIKESYYPNITNKLKITVKELETMNYVDKNELRKALKKAGILRKFCKFFGIQTQFTKGPYAHDVEAVLTRIYENRLTGTQLLWD